MNGFYFIRRGGLLHRRTRKHIRLEFCREGQTVIAVTVNQKRIITNAPVWKVERKPPYEL